MIRSANHSSYPKVGATSLDQQLRLALAARERGRGGDVDVEDAIDTTIALCVAEQSRAFIDIVTDGMIRWEGPLSFLAAGLDGLETDGLQRWFHTNFYDRRLVVTGDVARRGPFLTRDFAIAKDVAQAPLKVALPGPALVARLATDRHYGDPDRLADAVAAALAAEVAALRDDGATVFQLDESLVCRHPEDFDRAARSAATVFEAAGDGATTIVATSFGSLADVADRLGELPGTHVGLDLTVPGSWDVIPYLPEGRGAALGLFDATTTRQEDADDVAGRLAPRREALAGRDVIVGPNATLELLPRDDAFEKLLHARYLVEELTKEGSPWVS